MTRAGTMVFAARLKASQAAIFFLGQAGYVIRSGSVSIAIDPYLSDSVGKVAPDFARALPVPVRPEKLDVDIFIVTHDHLDHLDPETVSAYRHARTTAFVAPRLAAAKLAGLGVPRGRIRRVDSGESARVRGVKITGAYAVPTGASVIDTTGYRIEFPNGRSVYHTSDTAYSKVLLEAAPRAEVLLVCINGKWGNLNVRQAVRLAGAVDPRYAIPNHYDMMRLNAADPKEFKALMAARHPAVRVRILRVMKPFVW